MGQHLSFVPGIALHLEGYEVSLTKPHAVCVTFLGLPFQPLLSERTLSPLSVLPYSPLCAGT